MTRVFVYEHVTAVGLGREPDSPYRSLFVEGRAMRDAVAADFAALPGVEVLNFPDDLPAVEHLSAFHQLSSQADWSLVIAPETGGELERLAREVIAVGGRLLGPSPEAIAFTADKLRLAEHWRVCGVPTPPDFCGTGRWPVVVKPRDGAGSDSTFLVSTPIELAAAIAACSGPMIAQEFVPGRATSVAFLIGPNRTVPLLPAFQVLSTDGRFRYEGGALPIKPTLAERAVALGRNAVRCVPGLFGYVGVDLILGDAEDVAVEINPRLTTSYVGLRALAESSLAGLMLDVCDGGERPPVWRPGRVRLDPAGGTRREVTISFWA
jgi:tyramine---L-glutamate ligase